MSQTYDYTENSLIINDNILASETEINTSQNILLSKKPDLNIQESLNKVNKINDLEDVNLNSFFFFLINAFLAASKHF